MTERIATMLHAEAEALAVPAAPVQRVLADGRRRRRRTRGAAGVAGAAALVLVTTSAAALLTHGSGRAIEPARLGELQRWGAVAVGRDVYVGDAHATVDGDISAMYYDSAGVVVRTGGSYRLVRTDGEVRSISVDIPDRVPGFEPDSTRFAYAEPHGTGWQVVVHDAGTDAELARVPVDGTFTWGGWQAPPVAIDGDHVWVHFDGHWTDVDWRTGRTRDVPATERTFEVANGRYAVQDRRLWQVRAWAGSEVVGEADLPPGWYAFFSPDGRFLRAFPNEDQPPHWNPRVFDVATGASRSVGDVGDGVGWTPDGDLLIVDGDELRVCPPITGPCRSRSFDRGGGDLRIGGNPYES